MIPQVPLASPVQLGQASTNYPDIIEDKYLHLPASGQGRTQALAREIT